MGNTKPTRSKKDEEVLNVKRKNGLLVVDSKPMLISELFDIGFKIFEIIKYNVELHMPEKKDVSLKKFMSTCIKNMNDEK